MMTTIAGERVYVDRMGMRMYGDGDRGFLHSGRRIWRRGLEVLG